MGVSSLAGSVSTRGSGDLVISSINTAEGTVTEYYAGNKSIISVRPLNAGWGSGATTTNGQSGVSPTVNTTNSGTSSSPSVS